MTIVMHHLPRKGESLRSDVKCRARYVWLVLTVARERAPRTSARMTSASAVTKAPEAANVHHKLMGAFAQVVLGNAHVEQPRTRRGPEARHQEKKEQK
ncbi:unnamed protein product [Parajaminaea phylloscopi]